MLPIRISRLRRRCVRDIEKGAGLVESGFSGNNHFQSMPLSTPSFESVDLCSGCGMCCNGVMFHTVELQSTDSPRAIAALGVKLKHKAGKVYIQQPCPAFGSLEEGGGSQKSEVTRNEADRADPTDQSDTKADPAVAPPCVSCCTIYSKRPERCRLFECRQLTGVKAGTIEIREAQEKIKTATALVERLNGPGGLFERLGETNDKKPRAKRYNNIMAEPLEEGTDAAVIGLRAELKATMEELDALLDGSFRVKRVDIDAY